MALKLTNLPIVLVSPIEFAITGPYQGKDRVLVRSEDAGLDLIGLAAQTTGRREKSTPDIFSQLFGSALPLCAISSYPVSDVDTKADSRLSSLGFAWKGHASPISIEKIQDLFNLQVAEIYRAISVRDPSEIEWLLGPIILRCVRANDRRLRARRALAIIGIIYLMIGGATFFWAGLRVLTKSI